VDDKIVEPVHQVPYTLDSALRLVAAGTSLGKAVLCQDLELAAFTFLVDSFGMDEAGTAFRRMACRIVVAYRMVVC
jgi:hypothetical protein